MLRQSMIDEKNSERLCLKVMNEGYKHIVA